MMDRSSCNWRKSAYVSCIKLNGKPIIPPLMTPERTAEMVQYRQLAMAVEARLQRLDKDCDEKRNSVDSGVTILSSNEHPLSYNINVGRTICDKSAGEIESKLNISKGGAPLNTATLNKLVSCNGLEKVIFRTITSTHLQPDLPSALENCQHIDTPKQQYIVQNSSNGKENYGQGLNIADSGSESSKIEDPLISNNKDQAEFPKDIKCSDKCAMETVEQSSGLSLTDSSFSSKYAGYKPWEKLHSDNSIINEGNKILKSPKSVNISRSIEQETKFVTGSYINGNSAHNTQQRCDKGSSHYCLVDNISPTIKNVELNSGDLILDTDGHRSKYLLQEVISIKRPSYGDETHSEEPFEHDHQSCLLQSQNAEKPNIPVQDISHSEMGTCASDDVIKPVKICEAVMDISKDLQSETSGNEESLKCSTWKTIKRVPINKCAVLRHSSPDSTEFCGSANISSSTPHLLMHENMEDSVSSVALTSSTDLNHYMNTTESSGSGSPGRDVAILRNCHWIDQDVFNSTENTAVLPMSLSKNSSCRQTPQTESFSESDLILQHSFIVDRVKTQKYVHNFIADEVETGANINKVEKVAILKDSQDLKIDCSGRCPEKAENVSSCTDSFDKLYRNVDCYLADQVKCLSVPKLKLHYTNNTTVKSNNCEKMVITQNECVKDSYSTETNVKQTTDWNVLKEVTPPRLLRQNSYTLDSPSPLLVAHMETQKKESSDNDMTHNAYISPKPCRKAWDLTQAKSKWDLSNKKDDTLFVKPTEKTRMNRKVKSPVIHSSRRPMSRHQNRQNSSLPASNTSSPIKLQSPFASLDCLPYATSTESVKTYSQSSALRKDLKDLVPSPRKRETNRSRTSWNKFSIKDNVKNLPVENLSVASHESSKKVNEVGVSVSANSRQDLRTLILHLQSEHSQQMAELLAKQRKEQEEMRKSFVKQQNELVQEIHISYPTTISTSQSDRQSKQQDTLHVNLAVEGSANFNSVINPLLLSTRSLPLSSVDTINSLRHEVHDKTILSDTTSNQFQITISASAEKEQNAVGSILSEDSALDKMEASKDVVEDKQVFHFENDLTVEVSRNLTQNSCPMTLSEYDSAQGFIPTYSSPPNMIINRNSQASVLQHLQKCVNSNRLENTEDNASMLRIAPQLMEAVVNVPVSVASFPRNVDQLLQGKEINFPLYISDNPPPCALNEVKTEDRRPDRGQNHGTCIRELFPTREKGGTLSLMTTLCRSDLEKMAATRITAAARGYLTRRLFRTARVQDLILTIRDTLLCAMQLNRECWPDITSEDVELHRRLIQQVTAACYSLHEIFFSLPTSEQMAIIATDREKIRNQTPRLLLPRPLSAATRRVIERKMMLNRNGCVPKGRPMSAGCSLHRLKSAGVDKYSHYGNFEVGQNYIVRRQQQQQPQQAQLQSVTKSRHSRNVNGGRKPWR